MSDTHQSVLRTFIPPALWLFALPIVAIAFSAYTVGSIDASFHEVMVDNVASEAGLDAAGRAEAMAGLDGLRLSTLCATQGFVDGTPDLADVCGDLWQLGWIGTLGWLSVLLGIFTTAGALAMAALAWARTDRQVLAFGLGWNLMRATSATQAVMQGVLVVALSFWLTAWFFSVYVVKLIVIAAVLAAVAVWKILQAIFTRPDITLPVEGSLLTPEAAPDLWARVRSIAQAIGTAPPDRIIAGIDDNFYVTEGEIRHEDQTHQGRTLYVSLSLLRVMNQDEADAVLAHEMAHYAGGDTAVSAQLVPMQARYRIYLQALQEGVITLPIFQPMMAFYALFEMARAKSSREREHTADAKAAAHTSPNAIGSALVRVGAYASYRGRVERSLFEQNEQLAELGIASRVASGFTDYAQGPTLFEDLGDAQMPHPFDSHPPMADRLAAVGSTVQLTDAPTLLTQQAVAPWTELIPDADELEAAQWAAYERRFAEAHDQMLAWRYKPSNDEELAHVLKYFPEVVFTASKGGGLHVRYDGLDVDGWPAVVPYGDFKKTEVIDGSFKKVLRITLHSGGKREVPLKGIAEGEQAFLQTLGTYLQRHEVAHAEG